MICYHFLTFYGINFVNLPWSNDLNPNGAYSEVHITNYIKIKY